MFLGKQNCFNLLRAQFKYFVKLTLFPKTKTHRVSLIDQTNSNISSLFLKLILLTVDINLYRNKN